MIGIQDLIKGAKAVGGDLSRIVSRELKFHCARPSVSTLFLTCRCNSRCRTCSAWKRDPAEEIKREIGLRQWQQIVDRLEAARVKTVEIFGGNVLLRKDVLIPLLFYLKLKNFIIHLPTNQIGLDGETAEAIAETVHSVYLSADATGERQDAIRGGKGAFKRVGCAVAKLARYRSMQGKPRIVCNTTVSKLNADHLGPMVEYALSAGFDEIHFEYAGEFSREHMERTRERGISPTPYYLRQDESILVDRDGARRLKENIRKVKEKYKKCGIIVVTLNIDVLSENDLVEGTIPHRKCYIERTEVTIDPSGNVIVCPFMNSYSLGNLVREPLEKIWNNQLHRKFRTIQNEAELELCRHCILGVQRNPGVLGSLKRVYLSRIEPKLNDCVRKSRRAP